MCITVFRAKNAFQYMKSTLSKDSREESYHLSLGRAMGGSEHTLSSKGRGMCCVQGERGREGGREGEKGKPKLVI